MERSDTPQLKLAQMMGFAEEFNPSCRLARFKVVIARSVATKQSILFRCGYGLLRFARNDVEGFVGTTDYVWS